MATLLKIEDIHKTFEAGTVNENHVLKGLDLTVEEGDFISVIGGNGAGKSTLMNILAGGLQVDQGEILLEGKSIKQTSVRKRAKDIARVFQDPKMGTASRLTIEENMAIAYRRGKTRSFFKRSITEEERQAILQEAGDDVEVQQWLNQAMANPLSAAQIGAKVENNPAIAAQVYLAARVVCKELSRKEIIFLANLAEALHLDEALVEQLEAQAGL